MAQEIEQNKDNRAKCPKCGSPDIFAAKKGFMAGKGCLIALIMLPIAVFAFIFGGLWGANKVKLHCMNCRHRW